jgi:zinc D-Ala-D-Ala dipeptidase
MAAALCAVLAAAPDAGAPEPLVDLATVAADVVVDLRYATADNFMKKAVYPPDAHALLLAHAATMLAHAAERLRQKGFRLAVYDAYRPLSAQWELWRVKPQVGWVADPRTGSHHNRGAAVDLTLVTLDGQPVEMPSDYDFFGKAAHQWYRGGTESSRRNRDTLREAMEAAGFKRNPMEWWHFELPDAVRFPLRDEPLGGGSQSDGGREPR